MRNLRFNKKLASNVKPGDFLEGAGIVLRVGYNTWIPDMVLFEVWKDRGPGACEISWSIREKGRIVSTRKSSKEERFYKACPAPNEKPFYVYGPPPRDVV